MKPHNYIILLETFEYLACLMLMSILLYSIFNNSYGMSMSQASIHMSAFGALLYCFIAIGGIIGDKYIGNNLAMIIGVTLIVIGYLTLMIVSGLGNKNISALFFGLSLLCSGTGILKSNSSKIYADLVNDKSTLDIKFLYFLILINIGAFAGSFLGPIIKSYGGWFAVVTTCFIITLICCLSTIIVMLKKKIITISSPSIKHILTGAILLFIMLISSDFLFKQTAYILYFQSILVLVILFFISKSFVNTTKVSTKSDIFVPLALVFLALCISFISTQRTISVNTFTILATNHTVLGYKIPPESFQSFDSLWMIIFAPLCIYIMNSSKINKLSKKYINNILYGSISCTISYIMLFILSVSSTHIISGNWIMLYQFFTAVTELLIASTGMAIICSLFPKQIKAISIGIWFILLSYSHMLSGYVVKNSLTNISNESITTILANYSHIFGYISLFGLVVVVVSLHLRIKLNKQNI